VKLARRGRGNVIIEGVAIVRSWRAKNEKPMKRAKNLVGKRDKLGPTPIGGEQG